MKPIFKDEILNTAVSIYGYNMTSFSWKDPDMRQVYRATGIFFQKNGNSYILTARDHIVSCKKIVAYHYHGSGDNVQIMKNYVTIIYQSVKHNVMILASVDYQYFNIQSSIIISDNCAKLEIPHFHMTKTRLPSGIGYAIVPSFDLQSNTIKFIVDVQESKINKARMWDQSFVPESYLYPCNVDLIGTQGAPVFTREEILLGMITYTCPNESYILPSNVLYEIIDSFYNNQCEPIRIELPVPIVTKKRNAFVDGNLVINIDNLKTDVHDNTLRVYDSDYNKMIHLEIYLNKMYKCGDQVKINIEKYGQIESIYYELIVPNDMIFSGMKMFNPDEFIPFLNVNNYIIVQLSHELINTAVVNGIILSNQYIDQLLNGININTNMLIVIDHVGPEDRFPKLHQNTTVLCPIIETVNGLPFTHLDNLKTFLENNIVRNITCSDDYIINLSCPIFLD